LALRPVCLGTTLLAAQRVGLDWLGEMRHTRLGERLADEQPARARLNRNVNLLATKAPNPVTNTLRRGANTTTLDLARLAVNNVESDFALVARRIRLDRHWRLLKKLRSYQFARVSRAEREAPTHATYARTAEARAASRRILASRGPRGARVNGLRAAGEACLPLRLVRENGHPGWNHGGVDEIEVDSLHPVLEEAPPRPEQNWLNQDSILVNEVVFQRMRSWQPYMIRS
jgi:hypothetical protein